MRFSAISAIGLLALSASASPTGNNPGNELVSRATRSSQGWYSYGCYMDCYDGMERYLPHFAYKDASNSPNKCIDACQGAGFNYAGLQFGDECYCGSQLAGPPTKPAECSVKCADGNKCGGPCRNNIWSAVAKAGH